MSSGETAFHVTRWAKHAFQLSAKPSPQDSKDGADLCTKNMRLAKIYMNFIELHMSPAACHNNMPNECMYQVRQMNLDDSGPGATFTK